MDQVLGAILQILENPKFGLYEKQQRQQFTNRQENSNDLNGNLNWVLPARGTLLGLKQ